MAAKRPNKKDVALALLAESGVFVHVDPRRPKVVVPEGFRGQPELVLQFGLNMVVPIRDLEVDDEAISGTLSFQRRPFWCRIPWEAVFAIVSDEDRRGVAWPEDAPPESKLITGAARPAPPKRPHLRAVGADETQDDFPTASADALGPSVEGTCRLCSTKWVEDASSCVICGASQAEAFRPNARPSEDRPIEHRAEPDDEGRADEPSADEPAGEEHATLRAAPDPIDADASESESESSEPSVPPPDDDTPPTSPGSEPRGRSKSKRPPWLRVVK